uniref:F-box domain-containing protein n=1 Tax=Oryza meridionalis TaxID=40149 RepID=A0A0E0ERU3_9ORYZ
MEATASMLQARDWSSLPTDVLVLILERMRWSTHPSVVLVCQQWRSAVSLSPFYPAWITPLLLNTADIGTANIRYYSPYYDKNFEVDDTLKRLFGIELTFTIEIASSIRNNSGEWEDWKLAENHLDWSKWEVIAVYDPCRHDEGFKILDKLNSFGFKGEDSYLLESNQGELMVVLIERYGKMVHVVKLNEQRMEWEKPAAKACADGQSFGQGMASRPQLTRAATHGFGELVTYKQFMGLRSVGESRAQPGCAIDSNAIWCRSPPWRRRCSLPYLNCRHVPPRARCPVL